MPDTYYMLIPAGRLPMPEKLPPNFASDQDLVVADSRCVPLGEIIDDDAEAALLENRYRLVHLEPRGAVIDDGGCFLCLAGWKVTGTDPDMAAVLGPEAARILTVIRQAEDALIDAGEDDPVRAAYTEAINEDWPAISKAEDAAVAALNGRGIDGEWWLGIGSCQYSEPAALAARDLIGTTPEWTQEAYDTLTAPWRKAFGQPVHPGDKVQELRALEERT